MKLYAPTQAASQALADRAHAFLIANSAPYAQSVADGKTVRWAIPQQDAGGWWIAVADRCLGAFSVDEQAAVVEGVSADSTRAVK